MSPKKKEVWKMKTRVYKQQKKEEYLVDKCAHEDTQNASMTIKNTRVRASHNFSQEKLESRRAGDRAKYATQTPTETS
ncbi:Os07g0437900 [Oryza sativa Japonica Group]|uniref:Os07g0437900 protein n=1 Tax=Oryza sativa subsp. japonica TaxID=39947 RepID=A0A0P0X5G3_ORYSJ|nr:Os07g0437900 [Oryza sativa Japonica Group]